MKGSSPRRQNASARAEAEGYWPSAVLRVAGFICIWLVFAGADLEDVPAAAAAVCAATWTSLRLLEPKSSRRSVPAIAHLVLFFLFHSIVAGVDVARRALDPRLPLRPGFMTYPTCLPRGLRRNVFATLTSLLPGTVPSGEHGEQLVYHCLDIEKPVMAELSAEEAALVRALYND